MLRNILREFDANRRDYLLLLLLFALSFAANWLWLSIDTVPSGPDPSGHFLRSLYYEARIEGALSGQTNLTSVASEYQNRTLRGQNLYPPGVYVTAIPAIALLGKNYDTTVLAVNSVYLALLLLSTYWLGRKLFGCDEGVLAAALLSLFPTIFGLSREFFLEFALLSVATFNIAVLAYSGRLTSRLHAILFGIAFGFGMMVKFTYPVFLLAPVATLMWGGSVQQTTTSIRRNLPNLALAALMALIVMAPWYAVSFMPEFMLKSVDSYNEGTAMPPVLSIESFLYNPVGLLNNQLYLVYFLVFLAALLQAWRSEQKQLLLWLLVPLIIFTFLRTKDPRFITGILPIVALLMARRLCTIKPQKLAGIAIGFLLAWGVFVMLFASFGSTMLPEQIYIGTESVHATLLAQPRLHNYASVAIPRTALHEDWKVDEIISAMETGSPSAKRACLLSFHPQFDIGAFKHRLFSRKSTIDMPSTGLDDICNRLQECEVLIYKEQGPETQSTQPYIYSIVKPTYACADSQLSTFNEYAVFSLPDGTSARIYLRK